MITAAGLTLTGITAAGVTAAGGLSIVTNISDAVEGAQDLILGVIGKSPEQERTINITKDSWTALGGNEKWYNNIQIASSIASVGGLELFAPYAGSFNTTRNSKVNVNQNNSVKNAGASEVKELRRPYIRKGVRQEVENRAERAADGRFLDANEKTPIDGKYDLGHKAGNEHRVEVKKAQSEGLTQKEFNDRMNNPDLYQIEDPSLNRSHKYEKK